MGPDGLIDLIKTWRTAFPDGRMEIDDLIVEGDTVAIRNTWYGTQEAEFYGIPPSGKSVAVTSVGIDRVQDGLVTEGWGELDMVGMMQQLGALPIVGPGAVATGGDPTWGPTESSSGDGSGSPDANKAIAAQLRRSPRQCGRGCRARARRRRRVRRPQPGLGHRARSTRCSSPSSTLRAAMPDLMLDVDEPNMVARATRSPAHSVVRGTHTGEPLYGAEPSGKEVVWTHSDFVRIAGGQDRRALDGHRHADAVPAGRRAPVAGRLGPFQNEALSR